MNRAAVVNKLPENIRVELGKIDPVSKSGAESLTTMRHSLRYSRERMMDEEGGNVLRAVTPRSQLSAASVLPKNSHVCYTRTHA